MELENQQMAELEIFHDTSECSVASQVSRSCGRTLKTVYPWFALYIALVRYVTWILAVNSGYKEIVRMTLTRIIVGKPDYTQVQCMQKCHLSSADLTNSYHVGLINYNCISTCNSHYAVLPHIAMYVGSLGMMTLIWDPRIRWFRLEACGLAYWTRLDVWYPLLEHTVAKACDVLGIQRVGQAFGSFLCWVLVSSVDFSLRSEIITVLLIASFYIYQVMIVVSANVVIGCLRWTKSRFRCS